MPGDEEKPGAPLFRLAAWAARRLGSTEKFHDLDEADREIIATVERRRRRGAPRDGPELRFPGGGDTTLLQIAVHLARLRQRKTAALRCWRPVLDRLVGKEPAPASGRSGEACRQCAPQAGGSPKPGSTAMCFGTRSGARRADCRFRYGKRN